MRDGPRRRCVVLRNDGACRSIRYPLDIVQLFPQELFIRKRPYGHLGHHATIKFHIIRTRERERPTLEDTCSRLTDEWWNICSSCWTRDPLRRPSILTVIEGIKSLQVHHRYEFPGSE